MGSEDFDIRGQERRRENDRDFERALRPLAFDDFAGQEKIISNLGIFVKAALLRSEPLDHTLLHGPPGLGKTTLANIVANEMGVGFKVTSGPVLDKPGDLAGILMSLEPHDVLFIDEIHRLHPIVGGIPLFGDGGLPYRHTARQGAGGKERAADAFAFHARRGHHAGSGS